MSKEVEEARLKKYFTEDGTPLELVMSRGKGLYTDDGTPREIAEVEPNRVREVTKSYTKEEVSEIVSNVLVTEDGGLISKRKPFTDRLVGKTFKFLFDKGPEKPVELEYTFIEKHKLLWSGQGAENRPAYYEALDADDTVVMVHHMRRDKDPIECLTLFIDTESYLVTCAYNVIGNEYEAREVSRVFWFGAAQKPDGSYPSRRQGYSDYLVGKTIRWEYFRDEPNMNHVYLSNCMSAACVLLPKAARGMGGTFPSRYVGLKDTLQIYSWVEERAAGIHGMIAVDLREADNGGRVTDVGCFFGFNVRDTLEYFTYGGPGKFAPMGVINEKYSE
ncbi:MAG: MoaF N-terminal domain-containing protein [Clostridiales bacterium]|jgi:hypothetical protein|nr:MoaF N-terminal domain-containing protein [Clostridiales bacterium]